MGPPYPTHNAARFLTERLGLPSYDEGMQDWPLDVADGSRLVEFCDAYQVGMPDEETQTALMHLLLVSLDEVYPYQGDGAVSPPVEKQAARIASWLTRDFALYIKIIDYWRSGDDPDPEHCFAISPLMRRIWKECVDAKTEESHNGCDAV